jgi:hypothetical protein
LQYNGTEVASYKSSLLLNILFQNTQTLQIFTINITPKLLATVIKNAKQEGLH